MPHHDLEKVREAAKLNNIEYRGFKLYRDIANLGYEKADVADCIEQLLESEFSKTIQYQDFSYDDVYLCSYTKKNNENAVEDKLYIKLRLVNNFLSIDLGSFHL
ncbi:hypothetical protein MNBD_GAMMA01-1968 [hydrothermal vent metagenome]|uniref:Uncharacterized protein n=1 Tax=hydrothermal vent metagenome TaxID=652676 RepID=A0A3B0VF54_9ZZZZ